MTLTTVHQAKGLEWLPSCSRLSKTASSRTRRAREATSAAAALTASAKSNGHVGVTRAKEHLVMTRAAERGGAPTRPCPFLARSPPKIARRLPLSTPMAPPRSPRDAPRPSAAEAAAIDGSERRGAGRRRFGRRWMPWAAARAARRCAIFWRSWRRPRGAVGWRRRRWWRWRRECAAGGGAATVDQPRVAPWARRPRRRRHLRAAGADGLRSAASLVPGVTQRWGGGGGGGGARRLRRCPRSPAGARWAARPAVAAPAAAGTRAAPGGFKPPRRIPPAP